jgi:hypothetical protein
MKDVKFGASQQCPKCGEWNMAGLKLPEECGGACLRAKEVPCGDGLEGLLVEIERILYGIDKTELECSAGWWETSTGAEYGARKLEKIRNLLKEAD